MKLISVGFIARPHGLKGAFFLAGDSGPESHIALLKTVYLRTDKSYGPFVITEATRMNRGWKVQLEGFESILEIEKFKGATVLASQDVVKKEMENGYLVEELVGVNVFQYGKKIGQIFAVEPQKSAPDRWWVKLENGEDLAIPAVKKYIHSVDLDERLVTVQGTETFP